MASVFSSLIRGLPFHSSLRIAAIRAPAAFASAYEQGDKMISDGLQFSQKNAYCHKIRADKLESSHTAFSRSRSFLTVSGFPLRLQTLTAMSKRTADGLAF